METHYRNPLPGPMAFSFSNTTILPSWPASASPFEEPYKTKEHKADDQAAGCIYDKSSQPRQYPDETKKLWQHPFYSFTVYRWRNNRLHLLRQFHVKMVLKVHELSSIKDGSLILIKKIKVLLKNFWYIFIFPISTCDD